MVKWIKSFFLLKIILIIKSSRFCSNTLTSKALLASSNRRGDFTLLANTDSLMVGGVYAAHLEAELLDSFTCWVPDVVGVKVEVVLAMCFWNGSVVHFYSLGNI